MHNAPKGAHVLAENRADASNSCPTDKNGLTVFHIGDMAIHVKMALNISDVTMCEVKREAARRRRTMSEMVEAALRMIVEPKRKTTALPPLPEFSSGGLRVNVANRYCPKQSGFGQQ
ncbi:MAG: hypothetical protein WC381_07965 [Kiritimatiellia bacterium]